MPGLPEHLDQNKLRELHEVLGAEFAVLVTAFLADSDVRMAAMRRAIATADADGLREAAHALKGSCLNVGANALAALCHEMELLAAVANTSVARMRFDALIAELDQVAVMLADNNG